MRYCSPCAKLHGWPFDIARADGLHTRCEVCGNNARHTNKSDALLAPNDGFTDAMVVELLLGDLVAEVRADWGEFLAAAGEEAAQGCRLELLASLGWEHKPGVGDSPAESARRLRRETNQAYKSWARRLRTVAVLARVLRELGGTP